MHFLKIHWRFSESAEQIFKERRVSFKFSVNLRHSVTKKNRSSVQKFGHKEILVFFVNKTLIIDFSHDTFAFLWLLTSRIPTNKRRATISRGLFWGGGGCLFKVKVCISIRHWAESRTKREDSSIIKNAVWHFPPFKSSTVMWFFRDFLFF